MGKTNKHKSSKRNANKKANKIVKLTIKKPPFSSPGTSNTAVKKEKSARSPDHIQCEILLDKNMILFWIEKANGEAAHVQPLSDIIDSNTKQAKNFREHANVKAPSLTRRTSRGDHRPMLSKHRVNVKRGQTNYPFRCILGIKTDDIDTDDYVSCVMHAMKNVINSKSNFPTKCIIDVTASNVTPSFRRSLDSVVTDKSAQTVLYRYYFSAHLTDDNFDDETSTYQLPDELTTTFVDEHPTLAPCIFTPHEGKYSFLATQFGYKNPKSETKKSKIDKSSDEPTTPKSFFHESDDSGEDIEDDSDDISEDTHTDDQDSQSSFIDDSSVVSVPDTDSGSVSV